MSESVVQRDPQRVKAVAALGPVPEDPTLALVYAQRCMLLALREVATEATLDPESRIRWIVNLGSKIGLTHAKTLEQHKLDEVASRVLDMDTTRVVAPVVLLTRNAAPRA